VPVLDRPVWARDLDNVDEEQDNDGRHLDVGPHDNLVDDSRNGHPDRSVTAPGAGRRAPNPDLDSDVFSFLDKMLEWENSRGLG